MHISYALFSSVRIILGTFQFPAAICILRCLSSAAPYMCTKLNVKSSYDHTEQWMMRWKETAAPASQEYHQARKCGKICSSSLKLLHWKSEITESCLQLHLMISWMSVIHRRLHSSSSEFRCFPGVWCLAGMWIYSESTGRTIPQKRISHLPSFITEINSSYYMMNSQKFLPKVLRLITV